MATTNIFFCERNDEMIDMTEYWNNRYRMGGNSGAGSYNVEAVTKAQLINHVIDEYKIRTISELGCGDGNNLLFYKVPTSYTGYDYSKAAIEMCKEKTRKIANSLKYYFTDNVRDLDYDADLLLLLDVWYHQVEDNDFEALCDTVFNKFNGKYIIAYTTDTNEQVLPDGTPLAAHVRFREFMSKVQEFPQWEVLMAISGFNSNDGKQVLFPQEKKMFLLRKKVLQNE